MIENSSFRSILHIYFSSQDIYEIRLITFGKLKALLSKIASTVFVAFVHQTSGLFLRNYERSMTRGGFLSKWNPNHKKKKKKTEWKKNASDLKTSEHDGTQW